MHALLPRVTFALAVLVASELTAAPMMGGGPRAISNAISTNVRLALRPTFTIRSRHAAEVKAVGFVQGGGWFAAASENGGVQIWETVTGQKVIDMADNGPIEHLLLLPRKGGDARAFARAEPKPAATPANKPETAPAKSTPPAAAKDKKAPPAHQQAASSPATGTPLPPKEVERRPGLATVGKSGTITLWDTVTGTPRHRLQGHGDQVTGLTLLPGEQMLSAGRDGVIIRWNTETGKEAARFNLPGPVTHLSASPNGQRLAVVADGKLLLLETNSGQPTHTLAQNDAVTATWSPDSATVAAAMENGTLTSWDAGSGAQRWQVQGGDADPVAMAYSPDGRQLAVADKDRVIRVWTVASADSARAFSRTQPAAPSSAAPPPEPAATAPAATAAPPGPPRELRGSTATINALVFAPGGSGVIATASEDRMVHFWSATGGHELARLVAMRSGWAAVAPEGFFDGTLDGATEDRLDAVSWDVKDQIFKVDGFLEGYFRPGLLGRLLTGEKINLGSLPNVQEGFPLPPRITIEMGDADPATGTVSVMATVEDQGGGIGEVRLFHNGKVLDTTKAEEMGATRGGAKQMRFKVRMMDGSNAIQGVALSKDRIESEMAKVLHTQPGGGNEPATMHIFAVGINKYKNPEMNLNFGVPDAKGVRNFFSASQPGTVARSLVDEIYDERATRNEIRNRLGVLKKTAPQDTVIIYLAGHGESVNDAWYFIPNEVDFNDVDRLHQVALSSAELRQAISEMGARYVLLLLDACKSGAALNQFSKLENNRTMAMLSRSTGIHVAAATTGEQYASELGQLGHGVFTYALLEGLKGASDIAPRDHQISVKELMDYLRAKVPALTQKYHTDMQDPVINMRGDDFIVVKTP